MKPVRIFDNQGLARPEASPPRSIIPSPLKIAVGIAAGLAALMFLAFAGLASLGMGAFAGMKAAKREADGFLDLLAAGRVDDAYASTAAAFRASVDAPRFRSLVAQNPALARSTRRTTSGMRLNVDANGRRVWLQMNLAGASGTLATTILMVQEAGRWKVEALNLS